MNSELWIMLKFNIQLHNDYLIHIWKLSYEWKITAVKWKESINKHGFLSRPGGEDIWTQIFPHGWAFDQRSCPRGGEFDQKWFQKFKRPGVAR